MQCGNETALQRDLGRIAALASVVDLDATLGRSADRPKINRPPPKRNVCLSCPGEEACSGHQRRLKLDFTSIALPVLSQRVAIFFFADNGQPPTLDCLKHPVSWGSVS